MEDITITFDDDMSALSGAVYINRKGFSDYTDSMNHTQEDEFNDHLDNLIENNRRQELRQYPFVSFTKPADFDPKEYCVEPTGWEHAEMREADEQAMAQIAPDRAKRHFYLMWLCVHPEEIEKLQHQLTLSTEELGKLRGIADPVWVEDARLRIAKTIRQVERMKKKYSAKEIADANTFIDGLKSERSNLGPVEPPPNVDLEEPGLQHKE